MYHCNFEQTRVYTVNLCLWCFQSSFHFRKSSSLLQWSSRFRHLYPSPLLQFSIDTVSGRTLCFVFELGLMWGVHTHNESRSWLSDTKALCHCVTGVWTHSFAMPSPALFHWAILLSLPTTWCHYLPLYLVVCLDELYGRPCYPA